MPFLLCNSSWCNYWRVNKWPKLSHISADFFWEGDCVSQTVTRRIFSLNLLEKQAQRSTRHRISLLYLVYQSKVIDASSSTSIHSSIFRIPTIPFWGDRIAEANTATLQEGQGFR